MTKGNVFFVRRMKYVPCCMEKVKCALSCADSGTCSLLACFEMALVFSLWISSSFGSSFVVEAAQRDHEVLSLSAKAKSLNMVLSLEGSFWDPPIPQRTHSMKFILHQCLHAMLQTEVVQGCLRAW